MLKTIEAIVTRRSNPTVHRVAFGNIIQSENEPVKDFVRLLQSAAKDCEFTCSGCQNDLSEDHVKDQLIRGIFNSTLQADVLAKAASLTKLEAIINHAEAFETALIDQSKLQTQDTSDVSAIRSSEYRRRRDTKRIPPTANQQNQRRLGNGTPNSGRQCNGCGSYSHDSTQRQEACPAWGQVCNNCSKPNHFKGMSKQPPEQQSAQCNSTAAIITT